LTDEQIQEAAASDPDAALLEELLRLTPSIEKVP
jgi:hypothetical protein